MHACDSHIPFRASLGKVIYSQVLLLLFRYVCSGHGSSLFLSQRVWGGLDGNCLPSPFLNAGEQINPINYSCAKSHCPLLWKTRTPPCIHLLHLNNLMPGADSCCGMQELCTDRCDEDELIPFLRE